VHDLGNGERVQAGFLFRIQIEVRAIKRLGAPIPEPITTPKRGFSSSETSIPLDRMAWPAASKPN
jgi:hypothetical protein